MAQNTNDAAHALRTAVQAGPRLPAPDKSFDRSFRMLFVSTVTESPCPTASPRFRHAIWLPADKRIFYATWPVRSATPLAKNNSCCSWRQTKFCGLVGTSGGPRPAGKDTIRQRDQRRGYSIPELSAARSADAPRSRCRTLVITCFNIVTMMIVIIVTIWLHAGKARGAGRAARFVFRELRPRAQRSLEGDPLRRRIIHVFRGDNRIGRIPVFDPLIECGENVVRGIRGVRTVHSLTKRICTGSTTAMSHSGHHEKTIEVPDVF